MSCLIYQGQPWERLTLLSDRRIVVFARETYRGAGNVVIERRYRRLADGSASLKGVATAPQREDRFTDRVDRLVMAGYHIDRSGTDWGTGR